jgi:hypothetical protein
MHEILKVWTPQNPLELNETLLSMKAYAPYHHLYAIAMCFSIANNQAEKIPAPYRTLEKAIADGTITELVRISGISLNMALEVAANESQPANRVFSPQNWVKAKSCLAGINGAIRNYFSMLPMMPGGQEIKTHMNRTLALNPEDFEYRWSAD